jgi:hypothetical protein
MYYIFFFINNHVLKYIHLLYLINSFNFFYLVDFLLLFYIIRTFYKLHFYF